MITTHEVRTSADDLLNLVPAESPSMGQPTPGQAKYMADLIEEIRRTSPETAAQADEYMAKMNGRWTSGRDGNASRWIDRLKAKAQELRSARSATVELEDGMYVLDGQIYKVQHAVHGSGNQYAKVLVPNEPGEKARFEYAPGVVRKLRPEHRMTTEQAREWGALYGTCVRCGALLTAEDSIERMMGPVCAGKI